MTAWDKAVAEMRRSTLPVPGYVTLTFAVPVVVQVRPGAKIGGLMWPSFEDVQAILRENGLADEVKP